MTYHNKNLFSMQDAEYREFQAKLIPNIKKESIIGIRTPILKKYALELVKNNDFTEFISILPHEYFEENQLHAFIVSELKDYDKVISELERFLPYVDNWATCDQLRPKIFKKHKDKLITKIRKWISSSHTYTIRFGVGMMMCHYLDDNFEEDHLKLISEIRVHDYYIDMMIAWYFATALAKQYDKAVKFIENNVLDTFIHNKTIQKARESYRVSDEHKEYLKKLKRNTGADKK